MGIYVFVLVVSVVLLPISWRRSGSMTRYVQMTGAPLVWVLLAAASVLAAVCEAAGAGDLGLALFTGALIGTAFVQVTLVRRGLKGPDSPLNK